MLKNIFLSFLCFCSACDVREIENESANKSEYSVLQYYEYEYREAVQDKPFIVIEKALDSNYTVVAFPMKNSPKGYVAILAKAKGVPKVKVSTEVDFIVTKETYDAVKTEVSLSSEVEEFIVAHVRP